MYHILRYISVVSWATVPILKNRCFTFNSASDGAIFIQIGPVEAEITFQNLGRHIDCQCNAVTICDTTTDLAWAPSPSILALNDTNIGAIKWGDSEILAKTSEQPLRYISIVFCDTYPILGPRPPLSKITMRFTNMFPEWTRFIFRALVIQTRYVPTITNRMHASAFS